MLVILPGIWSRTGQLTQLNKESFFLAGAAVASALLLPEVPSARYRRDWYRSHFPAHGAGHTVRCLPGGIFPAITYPR